MLDTEQTRKDINAIKAAFSAIELKGSLEQIFELIAGFEKETAQYTALPHLDAIIKWHKNLFFQKAYLFQRAEELLEEALDTIEGHKEPLFQKWRVKIYLSLGYVHRAQWNYLDAEFYLTFALKQAESLPELNKFLGEIYSGLSQVCLFLTRHYQANQYAALEKKVCSENYIADPSSESSSIIYAYALVNRSRIKRLLEMVEQENLKDLDEAVALASRFSNEKCKILCDLEMAEVKFSVNHVGQALDMALELESGLKEHGMLQESLQAGLLAAKAYRKLHDYETAENKVNEILHMAKNHYLQLGQIIADSLYELGLTYFQTDQEKKAYNCFRESAKTGMVLGIKSIIIRAFDAAKNIDKYTARELLTSNLAYQDATFVKNSLSREFNPFKNTRTKTRLYATTLFIDIVGFSHLMKKSDESMTIQMVDEFIDRMSLIIYQNHGYIDKFLGDGFMAIFEHGLTVSSEMVMNAIRSGIDIYRALKHKNRKLGTVYGEDSKINVRIGISTGEIFAMILGNYIKTEFTYLGNSVNLASKLESHAKNQCMLIDEETQQQAGNRILSEPETIIIPGLGETNVHKVLRLARMRERPAIHSGKAPLT
ncbi:MAG: adenylate/guanylate cyclase domain-containing protein [Proteobacteria bacterium]|nr:adenylate/guanylate cyclase domain-containing protein [Pseudomonadota bacterium]MBU4035788.1 adenylate/guanylate cyclase domain-containing protein [Pseudomonadota bacterium]